MTSYHKLGSLEKTAARGALKLIGDGLERLGKLDPWAAANRLAQRKVSAGGGSMWRAADKASGAMVGLPGMALTGYSMSALPGSGIVSAITDPQMIPQAAITAFRNSTPGMQQKMRADVELGADAGLVDVMTLLQADPARAAAKDGLKQMFNQHGGGFKGGMYTLGAKRPPLLASWRALDTPDEYIKSKVRDQILRSTGMLKQAGRGLNILGGLGMLGSVGGAAYSALADKTYDADALQQEGYAAAQGQAQNKLNLLTPFERWMVSKDPSLAINHIEAARPGVTSKWEAATGKQYQPGIAGSIAKLFANKGSRKNQFYATDINGDLHYLPT